MRAHTVGLCAFRQPLEALEFLHQSVINHRTLDAVSAGVVVHLGKVRLVTQTPGAR
jgi:hypothetical protein